MSGNVKRLSAEDWEQAALDAIAADGLTAVAVERLARGLGVTKGSFYAHFRDRGQLVDAALRRWEQAQIEGFADAMQRFDDPRERLAGLATLAVHDARSETVQARAYCSKAPTRGSGPRSSG